MTKRSGADSNNPRVKSPDVLPSEFSGLVQLFIELRGRGLSLSAQDLEHLQHWQSLGIAAETIAKVMLDMAVECREKQSVFPSSLASVGRRVKKVVKQQAEF